MEYSGVTERWVGRKDRMGRRSYGYPQKEVELIDIEKGQIPGFMSSVLKSPQGVRDSVRSLTAELVQTK